jgi:hypothetical protein
MVDSSAVGGVGHVSIVAEGTGDVSRRMQDANHFNSAGNRSIEHEVIPKSSHFPPVDPLQASAAEFVGDSKVR